MNNLNYASFEASKKLLDAGIVLETDAVWEEKEGQTRLNLKANCPDGFPAPSMAEVWRELPEWTECKKQAVETKCVAMTKDNIKVFFSDNPTDALINLLIFIRKEKS